LLTNFPNFEQVLVLQTDLFLVNGLKNIMGINGLRKLTNLLVLPTLDRKIILTFAAAI